jgi:hypothetical protein
MPSRKRKQSELATWTEDNPQLHGVKWLYDAKQEVGGLVIIRRKEPGMLNEGNIYSIRFLGCGHLGTYTQQSLRARARKVGDNEPEPGKCNSCTAREKMVRLRMRLKATKEAAAAMTQAELSAIVQPFDSRYARWPATSAGLAWQIGDSQ